MGQPLVSGYVEDGELRHTFASGTSTFSLPTWGTPNQARETVSANDTLDTDADSGRVFYVNTDAVTVTLPATVVGVTYTFVNAGASDGAVAVTISPNASDKIMGAGITSADDKDLVNTKATANRGDYVKLIGDGVNGWYIQEMVGTWAREA